MVNEPLKDKIIVAGKHEWKCPRYVAKIEDIKSAVEGFVEDLKEGKSSPSPQLIGWRCKKCSTLIDDTLFRKIDEDPNAGFEGDEHSDCGCICEDDSPNSCGCEFEKLIFISIKNIDEKKKEWFPDLKEKK